MRCTRRLLRHGERSLEPFLFDEKSVCQYPLSMNEAINVSDPKTIQALCERLRNPSDHERMLQELLRKEAGIEKLLELARAVPASLDYIDVAELRRDVYPIRSTLQQDGVFPPWACPIPDLEELCMQRYGTRDPRAEPN